MLFRFKHPWPSVGTKTQRLCRSMEHQRLGTRVSWRDQIGDFLSIQAPLIFLIPESIIGDISETPILDFRR